MAPSWTNTFITALLLVPTIAFFGIFGLDIVLQNFFFDSSNMSWIVSKDFCFAKFIFYDFAKGVVIALGTITLIALIFFRKFRLVRENIAGLVIVLASIIIVPSTIGALKATTNMPCPKDINIYGGSYPEIGLFEKYPLNFDKKRIKCYPAGHASGGFALLSLIFLFKRKNQRAMAFAFAFCFGTLMGVYKMLIGDHFLSHTLVTMLIAWLEISLTARAVFINLTRANLSFSHAFYGKILLLYREIKCVR